MRDPGMYEYVGIVWQGTVRTEPEPYGSSVARAAAVPGSPQACEMEMGPNPTKSQKSCRIVSVADRNWEVESFGKVV